MSHESIEGLNPTNQTTPVVSTRRKWEEETTRDLQSPLHAEEALQQAHDRNRKLASHLPHRREKLLQVSGADAGGELHAEHRAGVSLLGRQVIDGLPAERTPSTPVIDPVRQAQTPPLRPTLSPDWTLLLPDGTLTPRPPPAETCTQGSTADSTVLLNTSSTVFKLKAFLCVRAATNDYFDRRLVTDYFCD